MIKLQEKSFVWGKQLWPILNQKSLYYLQWIEVIYFWE